MINPAELVKRPFRERGLLPIATDAQVIEDFQERIERIGRESLESYERFARPTYGLLHMSGGEEYSLIGGRYFHHGRLRVERSRAQELLFEVMSAHGFDPEKSGHNLRPREINKGLEEDVTERPDGTTKEVLFYPSKNREGLIFERIRFFVTGAGETTDIWWHVMKTNMIVS